MIWRAKNGRILELQQGDITRIEAGAIVNAANSGLAGGGGVDGAIHRAAGPGVMRELDRIRDAIGSCPPGKAVATGAGDLRAEYIFHTVGPVWRGGGHGEPDLLASCYRECLSMAEERALESIAFPAISTGVYGYPLTAAAEIAIREIRDHLEKTAGSVAKAMIILFSVDALRAHEQILAAENQLRKE